MSRTANGFDPEEFEKLCGKLGAKGIIEEVEIRYDRPVYFNKIREAIKTDRRGEVVFAVIRPNGKIITVASPEYPRGIFRIPTGGLGHGEDIVEAVCRETKEELGLEAEIIRFAGVIKIRFLWGNEEEMFYSYLFLLRETGGKLLEDATDDEVSEVKEVGREGLHDIAAALAGIEGEWRDWGRFRHVTTDAIYRALKEEGSQI